MGGGGSSSSTFSFTGRGSKIKLKNLLQAFGEGGSPIQSPQNGSQLNLSPQQTVGDYTDNNNPNLVKYQNQTDDKTARYLAKVDKETDINDLDNIQQQTNDPWGFYNNPLQKLVLEMGLNGQTTVLSQSAFDQYVNSTGATRLYRGVRGQYAVDRFNQSPNSHVGNGMNGDGYYFAPDISTARNYANGYWGKGVVMQGALSPNARVISLGRLQTIIQNNTSSNLRGALRHAGHEGTRTYSDNMGEAQMALKLGYNTIDAGWAVIPLTRDAVVVSSQTK